MFLCRRGRREAGRSTPPWPASISGRGPWAAGIKTMPLPTAIQCSPLRGLRTGSGQISTPAVSSQRCGTCSAHRLDTGGACFQPQRGEITKPRPTAHNVNLRVGNTSKPAKRARSFSPRRASRGQNATGGIDKPRRGRHPAPSAGNRVRSATEFWPAEIPGCRPYGADEGALASASHGWLAVGYKMSPLPWL